MRGRYSKLDPRAAYAEVEWFVEHWNGKVAGGGLCKIALGLLVSTLLLVSQFLTRFLTLDSLAESSRAYAELCSGSSISYTSICCPGSPGGPSCAVAYTIT
jgi:hypothetical protein